MDQPTKEVIGDIARIQMEALSTIINDPEQVNYSVLRKYLQIEEGDIVEAAKHLYNVYHAMIFKPQLIHLLNEYQLYICSHILFRMEDEWLQDNPSGVAGTWAIIMTDSEKFHPELNLVISNL